MKRVEPSSPLKSIPEEEDEEGDVQGEGITSYEQQRLSRISENRARLQALGLTNLASSLFGYPAKQQSPKQEAAQGKKRKQHDGDYRPSDDEDREDGESSSSSEEEEDYRPASGSRRKGKQKKLNATKSRNTPCVRGSEREFDAIDDDVALQQAISLSLGVAKEDLGAAFGGLSQKSGSTVDDSGSNLKKKANKKETAGKRNIKKGNKNRVLLTEDEVVAYFFSFDETGKGYITLRDLRRMVAAYDFTSWTDMDMANMIHCFDSDGDGKLSLVDFQSIVTRCKLNASA